MGVSIWEGGKAERAAAALETIAEYVDVIDDTAGTGDTDKTWSADKISNSIPSVPVQDIQVNGSSILNNGIANIPLA